jgi:FMN phosphatase YigB (HAD superfamily)
MPVLERCRRDLTGVRAVVFDVDGTLYRQSSLRRAMLLRLAGAHATHPARGIRTARVISAYRRAQEELRAPADSRHVADAQLRIAADTTGLTTDEVSRCVDRWMERAPLDVLPRVARRGLHETLSALRASGRRLGVLSDYPAFPKLEALGVAHLFDAIVCAQDTDVGAFKPNPRGLLLILGRLGVEPHEALYVGDRVDVDASTATRAGVRCAIVGVRRAAADNAYWSVRSLQELCERLEPA